MLGLFCNRALENRWYSSKETYNFKEPTNRSHPIPSLLWICEIREICEICTFIIDFLNFQDSLAKEPYQNGALFQKRNVWRNWSLLPHNIRILNMRNMQWVYCWSPARCAGVWCKGVCCSVVGCVVVCCSVLQCVAVCCSALQCVAVCCSVLQCVAVCCSVLQCVAVCCSVLQCIAVCCVRDMQRVHFIC